MDGRGLHSGANEVVVPGTKLEVAFGYDDKVVYIETSDADENVLVMDISVLWAIHAGLDMTEESKASGVDDALEAIDDATRVVEDDVIRVVRDDAIKIVEDDVITVVEDEVEKLTSLELVLEPAAGNGTMTPPSIKLGSSDEEVPAALLW